MRRAEQEILPPRKAQAVAATTAVVFTRPTRGIVSHTTGNFVGTFAGPGETVKTIPLLAGTFYPFALISVDATSAIAITALFVD